MSTPILDLEGKVARLEAEVREHRAATNRLIRLVRTLGRFTYINAGMGELAGTIPSAKLEDYTELRTFLEEKT
jgi:hypothetical protein